MSDTARGKDVGAGVGTGTGQEAGPAALAGAADLLAWEAERLARTELAFVRDEVAKMAEQLGYLLRELDRDGVGASPRFSRGLGDVAESIRSGLTKMQFWIDIVRRLKPADGGVAAAPAMPPECNPPVVVGGSPQ